MNMKMPPAITLLIPYQFQKMEIDYCLGIASPIAIITTCSACSRHWEGQWGGCVQFHSIPAG